MALFADRMHAGQALAEALEHYRDRESVVVLGLPRGGVPVAFAVAGALRAPLDVFVVRKLGVPGREELAMGAVASGHVRVINDRVVAGTGISEDQIADATERERDEVERRERAYRDDRPAPDIAGRPVILVDDGLATGSTMRAAVAALRQQQVGKVVVGVPVASPETCAELEPEVDELVCAKTPEPFVAIGVWYDDFSQTTDEEVRELLARAAAREQANVTARQ